MKKIFLFLLIISNLFAVKDRLVKPDYGNELSKRGYWQNVADYPESLSSSIGEDDKNVFIYDGHFRVIYGLAYKYDVNIESISGLASKTDGGIWGKPGANGGASGVQIQNPVKIPESTCDSIITMGPAFRGEPDR